MINSKSQLGDDQSLTLLTAFQVHFLRCLIKESILANSPPHIGHHQPEVYRHYVPREIVEVGNMF